MTTCTHVHICKSSHSRVSNFVFSCNHVFNNRTMSRRYEKVKTSSKDDENEDENTAFIESSMRRVVKRNANIEAASNKLHALMWIAADATLLYATDFFKKCFQDDRVNRAAFNLGVVSLVVFAVLILYASIWLPYVKRVTIDVQIYAPRLIPVATVFGSIASLGFMIGLWPVFGFFTPIILSINFFAFIMVSHFLPAI